MRKFFCMMFVSENGKKLDIFIATVFGGIAGEAKLLSGGRALAEVPLTLYENGQGCKLKFKFSSYEGIIKGTKFYDITDSFLEQRDLIKQFWGPCEECKDRDSAVNKITEYYHNETDTTHLSYKMPAKAKYYDIRKKYDNDIINGCVVTPGVFHEGAGEYSLEPFGNQYLDCVENINWVKTELELKDSLLGKRVQFMIQLDGKEYYTPDFTWYFAPPQGYEINEDKAVLCIGNSGSEERNRIQYVSDDTTVEFKEWKELNITDRKKVRVTNLRDDLQKLRRGRGGEKASYTIKANVDIRLNQDTHSNRQFFWGLIVAFVISFCADKTRMNDYYSLLHEYINCTCLGEEYCVCKFIGDFFSLVFPIIALLCVVSWRFDSMRALDKEDISKSRRMWRAVRIGGIALGLLLILYVFGGWSIFPKAMCSIINNCTVNNVIVIALGILSLGMNCIYIFHCWKLKNKIWDFL